MKFTAKDKFYLPQFGNLISFEGIDGCGKTTQIEKLKLLLENKGLNVLCLREPGGTVFGEKLRDAILNNQQKLASIAESYLFASSRAQLLKEKVLPFITQGPNNICILDRYIHSSISYQGFARKLGANTILDIHSHSPLNTIPNITYYLEISTQTSLERQDKRNQDKDYFEKEKVSFYNSLIEGYSYSSSVLPGKFIKIDGKLSPEAVHKEIMDNLKLKELS